MSFSVKPGTLDSAADAYSELREAMSPLCLSAIGPMQPGRGGFMIDELANKIEGYRDTLMSQYGFDGPARTTFGEMSTALRGLADDYRDTDAASAERSDAQLPAVEATGTEFTDSWIETQVKDTPKILSDGDMHVSVSNYDALVSDPEGSMESYENWEDLTQKVEDVLGMGWATDWLPNFGWDDPLVKIKDMIDGDWEALGRSIGAIEVAGDAWHRIAEDVAGIWQSISADWSGNAADSAYAWMQDLHDAAMTHGDSLSDLGNHLHSVAQSIRYQVDGIEDALEALGDLIPRPLDLGWWASNLLPTAQVEKVVAVLGRIDVIMALCGKPFELLEEASFDDSDIELDLPTLTYEAPAVGA